MSTLFKHPLSITKKCRPSVLMKISIPARYHKSLIEPWKRKSKNYRFSIILNRSNTTTSSHPQFEIRNNYLFLPTINIIPIPRAVNRQLRIPLSQDQTCSIVSPRPPSSIRTLLIRFTIDRSGSRQESVGAARATVNMANDSIGATGRDVCHAFLSLPSMPYIYIVQWVSHSRRRFIPGIFRIYYYFQVCRNTRNVRFFLHLYPCFF